MNSKFSTLVGMDVHARSITCSAIVTKTGEILSKKLPKSPKAGCVLQFLFLGLGMLTFFRTKALMPLD